MLFNRVISCYDIKIIIDNKLFMIFEEFSWTGWLDKIDDLMLEEEGLVQRDDILLLGGGGDGDVTGPLKEAYHSMLHWFCFSNHWGSQRRTCN